MAEDMVKQTCKFEWSTINAPVNQDTGPKLDMSEYDPTAMVSRVCHDAAYKAKEQSAYECVAVVMRVDYDVNGYIRVKARTCSTEGGDGMLPEPAEFVDSNVKSNSHFAIDQHRTFEGHIPRPYIGQGIKVSIPPGASLKHPGTILKLLDKRWVAGRMKSSKMAKQSAVPSTPNSLNLPAPPGDAIGGGLMDGASQIPGYGAAAAAAVGAAADAVTDFFADLF